MGKEVVKALHLNEDLIIMGDFNAKLEDPVNNIKADKSGKMLNKLVQKHNLVIVNNTERCQGKWTRINTKNESEKSVTDFMICCQRMYRNVEEMSIDDKKEYVLTKYEVREDETNTIESDHMMLSLQILHRKVEKTRKETRWNLEDENGWAIYEKLTESNKTLVNTHNASNIDEAYEAWKREFIKILKNSLKKKTIKSGKVTVAKTVKELIEKKKVKKRELSLNKEAKNCLKRIETERDLEKLNIQISRAMESERIKQIQNNLETLDKGGVKSNEF